MALSLVQGRREGEEEEEEGGKERDVKYNKQNLTQGVRNKRDYHTLTMALVMACHTRITYLEKVIRSSASVKCSV